MEENIENIIFEAVNRIFENQIKNYSIVSAEELHSLKKVLEEGGFFNLLLSENNGGAALTLKQVLKVFYLEGENPLSVEFVSTNLARLWLKLYSNESIEGSIAIEYVQHTNNHEVIGLKPYWFKEVVDRVLLVKEQEVFLIDTKNLTSINSTSDSSMQWLVIQSKCCKQLDITKNNRDKLVVFIALRSIAGCVGAMNKVLRETIKFSKERQQFGRTLNQFQAVQQQISVLVELFCSAHMAAEMAFCNESQKKGGDYLRFACYQINSIAVQFVNIVHAIHGAIGITYEYPVHFYTKFIRSNSIFNDSQILGAEKIGEYLLSSKINLINYLTD